VGAGEGSLFAREAQLTLTKASPLREER
jgi:hypothetical protein